MRRVLRWILAAVLFAGGRVAAATVEAERARRDGVPESHWHVGPFWEYRRVRAAEDASQERLRTFWALRPFYAQTTSPESVERDILWPVGTGHCRQGDLWWRAFFLAYGNAKEEPVASWNFTVLPLAFGGRTPEGRGYGGFFPFYGEHPHFLLMDDWRFVLWPVWMDYTVAGIDRRAVLWPLFTWKLNDTASVGVWPLYGHARLRESDHRYALWPIATWARYDEDRDTGGTGHSWMAWPLCGAVSRTRESQVLVLPPFFSYAETPATRRWRLPWPIVDVELGARRERVSVFPVYEHVTGFDYGAGEKDEDTTRMFWKIFEYSTVTTKTTDEFVFSFFPFVTYERRRVRAKDGTWRDRGRFLRVWPFYRYAREGEDVFQRVLELVPVRHAEGFDRNWAPFWTLWSAETRAGVKTQTCLWQFFIWRSEKR